MDHSTLISLLALIVSILALPTSYIVATRQVKVGLDEHERRVKQRTRILVADRQDELVSLFFSAAKSLAGIDLSQRDFDKARLERHIEQIDDAVTKTGILDRLGKAIDDYAESGASGPSGEDEIANRLAIIRGQIHRGRSPGIFATWDILNVCRGNELSSLLRAAN